VQKLERIVIFILLLFATGAGQAFFANPNASSTGNNQPVTEAVFALIYLALIVFLVKYRTAALRLLLTEKWLAALCVWALVSVAWSVEPEESLRRALALIGTTIAGLYLGLHFEPKQQVKVIAWAIGLGAIASVVVLIAVPSVGITPDGMQGVYNLKNSLGRMMSLGAFCFALLAIGERRRIRILASDVSLAREEPSRSSILNVLPARVVAIKPVDRDETVVAVALRKKGDGARLLSRVTQKSLAELGLAEGQSVYAQVKYVSLGPGRGEPEE